MAVYTKSSSIRALFLAHLCIILLVVSFFAPITRNLWQWIDTAFFTFFNHILANAPYLVKVGCAILNHKLTDWGEDIVFILFISAAIYKTAPEKRLHKTAQFIFSIFLAASIIFFINKMLFHEILEVKRMSPTLSIQNPFRLSHFLSFIKVKDASSMSFPGDHGTTLLLFCSLYHYFSPSKKLKRFALFYSMFRALPRLVVGAHWLSDIFVGGAAITLFCLSWALCTPFQYWATKNIENMLLWFNKLRKEQKTAQHTS